MNAIVQLELSDSEFSDIKELVFSTTGITLSDAKRELVKRRFAPRVRELGLPSFKDYVRLVQTDKGDEVNHFCNAITTNLTSFFRENHHFDLLKSEILPAIYQRNLDSERRIRIWSAGCSTGQEAYCLAIILRSAIPGLENWDARILATDLDEKCLSTARQGIYREDAFEKTPSKIVSENFTKVDQLVKGQATPSLQAKLEIRKLITFNKLNLMHSPWPMKGKFDVIFCRNVFIYFNKATQAELVSRYARMQDPGSFLCLGHSEVIQDPEKVGYKLIGKTAYQRV